jgi:hypothetical protein
MRETGDCIKPSSWDSKTSLEGIAARDFTPSALNTRPA